MIWWGKILGSLFGLALAGPIGLVIGVLFGHLLDIRTQRHTQLRPKARAKAQDTFFRITFSVMGHIAQADGQVSKEEIDLAQQVMSRMGLDKAGKQNAMNYFKEGVNSAFDLHDSLIELKNACYNQRHLLRVFIDIQMQASYADGRLDPSERKIILEICKQLDFERISFHQFNERIRAEQAYRTHIDSKETAQSIRNAYRILGISPSSSDTQVKKAYRRLIAKWHPDKLVAKGLPEEMIQFATKKTQEIKNAYEQIQDVRGLK